MSKKNKKTEEMPKETEDFKTKYYHLLADQENFRKRMQKDKDDMVKIAIESTIKDFLPIIDNFENALKFAQKSTPEVQSWAMGFQMILSQLQDILHQNGIVSYHSIGNQFDPLFHEAVEIVETLDHPERLILEEFAKGYKCQNRTLRPAKVKVTKKPSLCECSEGPCTEDSCKECDCQTAKDNVAEESLQKEGNEQTEEQINLEKNN
jgi:molecular chaperone GrpE